MTEYLKIFNDPIHGHIELHPLCVKIIDTPEFQRLRHIKQLGACYFVYPGAAHNRFEHCLGVCHLAGELVRAINSRQPQYCITSTDILCVEIAGLCHDLGHGPFSHMFDGKFIPQALPELDWEHEQASVDMFDHLVKKNDLVSAFEEYGLTEKDRIFIKEQIKRPSKDQQQESHNDWSCKGRDRSKSFLYEVVANKRNGIDVDKWDYFARDCHNLGISNNFDHLRFIKFARVLKVDDELQICSRDKEVQTLYDMFNTRVTLHKRAYQHRVNVIIECMITEAFLKADKLIKFQGTGGKMLTMSESIHDMEAYSKLNDCVFDRILNSRDPGLKEARDILRKILQRKFYKWVGQTKPKNKVYEKSDNERIKAEIVANGEEEDRQALKDNLIVEIISMNYGMKDLNPIDHVRFYNKSKPEIAMMIRKEEVSRMTPSEFTDQSVYLFTRRDDPEFYQKALDTFKKWCEGKKFSQPRGGSFTSVTMTPHKRQNPDTEEKHMSKRKREDTKRDLCNQYGNK
ncbi:deoxynucleoside triphosphate triphosphohydrolase SAMHD1-like isoform X2 [Ylistrum balloti]|nr:deoxynucleoside triphosphate triphosphohydrolase SAMHD1-like isoform X2 [Ylistrum balloti]XP_060075554.1 deoxynucleoside triphosphate triphosphohydrolase SAMHD1-like isoform X2 [Ylistrum balloti]XP_060075555.1 deoxynucleoside triphosphate triphosphohydrolase SAMHD1-like isoform X2 [Ylistrum balloti]